MLPLLLMNGILVLLCMIICGAAVEKAGLVTAESSRSLSVVLIYIITPCVIIEAYESPSGGSGAGLVLSCVAAVFCHVLYIALARLLKRPLGLSDIEQANIAYTNSGNLIIPLVAAVFGAKEIMYCSTFVAVQTFFVWTHGRSLVSGERKLSLRRVFLNINVIAVFIGLFLFITGIRLPDIVSSAMKSMGLVMGPVAMIQMGIILGGMKLRDIFLVRRAWFIAFIRLIAFPFAAALFYVLCGAASLVPDGREILTVSFLSAAAPCAVMITQFALVFHREYERSSAINIISTILCMATIPLMVWILDLLFDFAGY